VDWSCGRVKMVLSRRRPPWVQRERQFTRAARSRPSVPITADAGRPWLVLPRKTLASAAVAAAANISIESAASAISRTMER